MKTWDVIKTALGNTMRSKLRTFLTVIAIVIGAFTLTLTSGLGAGINQYVSKIVEGVGDEDQIYVMPTGEPSDEEMMGGSSDGPAEYDPEAAGQTDQYGMAELNDDDIDKIKDIDNVTEVDPMFFVAADYLETSEGDQYTLETLGFPSDFSGMELTAGELPDRDAAEIVIPETWLETVGVESVDNADDAVGEEVTIGLTNRVGETETVTATITGVSGEMLSGVGTDPTPSQALNQELYDAQNSGVETDEANTYVQAIASVDNIADNESQVKSDLADIDMMGMTVEDQLGMVEGIINTVTWVLNGFALIALLAASFGIVNTLLMSVQERTREIGLMKAVGMTNGKVFGLFSMEAVMIGLMGSVLGIGLGLAAGVGGNSALVNGPLSDVSGLTLFAIEPVQLLLIALLIIVIAFLAGTLPARRASKKDPIEALRYE